MANLTSLFWATATLLQVGATPLQAPLQDAATQATPERPAPPATENLEAEVEELRAILDTLIQRNAEYAIAADFFDSALDEQANRFALIVAGILALGGLVGLGGFRLEMHRLSKKFRRVTTKQSERHQEAVERLNAAERQLAGTMGNVFRLVARTFPTSPENMFLYRLNATSQYLKVWRNNGSDREKRVLLAALYETLGALQKVDVNLANAKFIHEEGLRQPVIELLRADLPESAGPAASILTILDQFEDILKYPPQQELELEEEIEAPLAKDTAHDGDQQPVEEPEQDETV